MYGLDNTAVPLVRHEVPDGPPAGRERRAVRAGVQRRRMGRPQPTSSQNHTEHCAATDVPIDGLLTDLKRRGLWDSTLVIWGGEFGRMPVSQGSRRPRPQPARLHRLDGRGGDQGRRELRRDGRDRLPGRRSTASASTTCTPRCCTCSGLDHKRLTYFHNGRSFRLTDVAGQVIRPILA